MLLEDLCKYASDQNKRIAKLPPAAIGPASSIWEEFGKGYWGISLASLEKEEPVEYDPDPVPGLTPPTNRSVLTITREHSNEWNIFVPGGKMLVRSEYHETERAVLSESARANTEVFVVAGQPGIGSLAHVPTVYGT